jgi:hypothetical protein
LGTVLAKDHCGVTLAEKSHPEASVEIELPNSISERLARNENFDEETKNYD